MKRYQGQSGFISKLVLIIGLVLVATFAIAGSFALQNRIGFNSKAATPSNQRALLILSLSKNPTSDLVTIDKITSLNAGYAMNYQNGAHADSDFTDEIQIDSDGVVETKKIRFSDETFVAPPQPNSGNTFGDPPIKSDKATAVIEVIATPNTKILIKNLRTFKTQSLPQTAIQLAVASAKQPAFQSVEEFNPLNNETVTESNMTESTNDNDGFFDIVYISSHYSDMGLFKSDVKAMTDFLFTVYPYSSLKNQIRVHVINNTQDLGCKYFGRGIGCDSNKVHAVAAQVPHDGIVVVENSNVYGGGSSNDYSATYRDVNEWAKEVPVHEMGHSIGWLADEYLYGVATGGYKPFQANCSYSPCKWANVPGTGCIQGCAFDDWYRPTENDCLMRTLAPSGGFHFDNVDKVLMRSTIASHTVPLAATIYKNNTKGTVFPVKLLVGKKYKFKVEVKNNGQTNWTKDGKIGLGFRGVQPNKLGLESNHIDLKSTEVVSILEKHVFAFDVTAKNSGSYNVTFQMVDYSNNETLKWFGNEIKATLVVNSSN